MLTWWCRCVLKTFRVQIFAAGRRHSPVCTVCQHSVQFCWRRYNCWRHSAVLESESEWQWEWDLQSAHIRIQKSDLCWSPLRRKLTSSSSSNSTEKSQSVEHEHWFWFCWFFFLFFFFFEFKPNPQAPKMHNGPQLWFCWFLVWLWPGLSGFPEPWHALQFGVLCVWLCLHAALTC